MIAIGSRVRVFWRDENEWFTGNVKDINEEKGLTFVVYDDGDEQWEPSTEVLQQEPSLIEQTDSALIEKSEAPANFDEAFHVVIFENNDEKPLGASHALQPRSNEDELFLHRNSHSEIEELHTDPDIESGFGSKGYDKCNLYSLQLDSPKTNSDHESSLPSVKDLPSYVVYAGTLFGCVVSADRLIYKNAPPNAFVKVSLLEKSVSRKMDHILGAKRALWTTPVIYNTQSPHWYSGVVSEDEVDQTRVYLESELSCFSLLLQAPIELDLPQWTLLPGTLIFTLYHQSEAFISEDSSGLRNEILYQAVVPLSKLVNIDQPLTNEFDQKTGWHLTQIPLESRQHDTPSASLTAAFHFTPTFIGQKKGSEQNRTNLLLQTQIDSKSKALSQKSKSRDFSLSMRKDQRQSKGRLKSAVKRSLKSSAQINRQKQEKKIQIENEKLSQRLALIRFSTQSQKKRTSKREASLRVNNAHYEENISNEVVELQTQLTEWKARVISLQRQSQKLETRNEKKAQMRDSLQRAFDAQTLNKQTITQIASEIGDSPHQVLMDRKEQQAQRYVQLQMQKKSLTDTVKKLEEKLEFVRRHRIFRERMSKKDNERRHRLKRQQLATSAEEDEDFALYTAQKEYQRLRKREEFCSRPSNQDPDSEVEQVLY